MADVANPFETPSPRGIRLVQATLRVGCAVQCFGLAAGQLHWHRPWPLFEALGPVYGLATDQLAHAQQITAYGLLACGLLTLLRPCWLVLLPVLILQCANALGPAISAESWWPWALTARWSAACVVPAALLLVDLWPPRVKPTLVLALSAISLLRLGTVATFAIEGARSLLQYQSGGDFAGYLSQAVQRSFRWEMPAEMSRNLVGAAGAASCALALCLLVGRSRGVAVLCVLWGTALASIHTLALGPAGYDLTLTRAGDAAAPLAILLFWLLAVRESGPEYLPQQESR